LGFEFWVRYATMGAWLRFDALRISMRGNPRETFGAAYIDLLARGRFQLTLRLLIRSGGQQSPYRAFQPKTQNSKLKTTSRVTPKPKTRNPKPARDVVA
jgi:hypothetical protein